MTYDPTVPAASQRISDTQPLIQNNFTVINDDYDVDHITYNTSAAGAAPPIPGGFHRKSSYTEFGGDPTAEAEIGSVYAKDNGDGRTDLFYRYDTGALGNSKILPLSAIKVMGAFVPGVVAIGLPVSATFQTYNIASITRTTAGTYTVLFSDPLDSTGVNMDLDYIVLLGGTSIATLNYVSPTKNDRIIITESNSGTARVSFTILTL